MVNIIIAIFRHQQYMFIFFLISFSSPIFILFVADVSIFPAIIHMKLAIIKNHSITLAAV